MSVAVCPRLFEAEAMRDGRLVGDERASFERHIAMCPVCAREVRALEALAETLCAAPRHDEADELHVRRERTRLLAAFDQALVVPERHRPPLLLLGMAAAAALVVCLAVLWRVRPALPDAPASSAVVHADAAAVWSKRREGDRDEVVLERGALWIHVHHAAVGGRFVVALPDGELEDIGTTFTVSAEDGRTKSVTVEEGRVLLRLRDRPPVTLASGDTWVADAPARTARGIASGSSEPALSGASAREGRGAPRRSPEPAGPNPAADPAADFRAAMNALDIGNNREAAARFEGFLQSHPRDARAEDAAYLRVIALQRAGDHGEMQDAARGYLRLYPDGFRHAEVDRLAR
jgi:hypothetical protein